MIGIEQVTFVSLVFAFILLGIFLLKKVLRPPSRHREGKEKAYTGGEDIPEENAQPTDYNLYRSITKILKSGIFSRMQSGDLTDYLILILGGVVVTLLALLW